MTDISKAEFEVLDAIWQKHPVTASEIIERLNQDKTWHEKTVKTLINRMVKKGALGFNKEGRRYLYFPMLEREAYTIDESESFIARLFGGRITPLIAGFARSKKLTRNDVDELKQIIAQWEKDNG